METWLEILQIQKQMDEALLTLRENGNAYALAEKEYRIAKAKKILELRNEGVAVTIIPDLAKGDEEIAALDFKRNIAKTLFESNKEALGVKKMEFSMYRTYYEKEYSSNE